MSWIEWRQFSNSTRQFLTFLVTGVSASVVVVARVPMAMFLVVCCWLAMHVNLTFLTDRVFPAALHIYSISGSISRSARQLGCYRRRCSDVFVCFVL